MKVRLQPVYSRLAETVPEELSTRLPLGWRLSQHQVETYQALTNDDVEVIFNTALTGDGKSLAGQLPILVRGGINYPILAMYPTNELIEDQQAQVERAIKTWNANVEYRRLNKAALDQAMAEDDYTRRGEAFMRIIRNGDLVLTNPDIFHYVMHQFYTYPDDAPDRYAAPLAQKFSQFTFDEFHVFDVPQVISVLNALLFIQETSGIGNHSPE
jgi:CRISPR-associated endonuclease/helicase Cas3